MKDEKRRIEKYKKKLVGEVIKNRLDNLDKQIKKNFKLYIAEQVRIEECVKEILNEKNISPLYTNYYILYAKQIVGKYKKQLYKETDINFLEWVGRGLKDEILQEIALRLIGKIFVREIEDPRIFVTFDEGVGDKSEDKSNYGNDIYFFGATWTTGKKTYAAYFPTGAETIQANYSESFDPINEFTLSLWFRPDNWPQPPTTPFIIYCQKILVFFNMFDMPLMVTFYFGPTYRDWILPSFPVLVGEWNHFILMYKPGDARIYLNGVLLAQRTDWTDLFILNPYPLELNLRTGAIDNLRTYLRFLTDEELERIRKIEA